MLRWALYPSQDIPSPSLRDKRAKSTPSPIYYPWPCIYTGCGEPELRNDKKEFEYRIALAEHESLGLRATALNELNDRYDIESIVDNLKMTYYQGYHSSCNSGGELNTSHKELSRSPVESY